MAIRLTTVVTNNRRMVSNTKEGWRLELEVDKRIASLRVYTQKRDAQYHEQIYQPAQPPCGLEKIKFLPTHFKKDLHRDYQQHKSACQ
jgi:hypothetical protein